MTPSNPPSGRRHLLGINGLSPQEIVDLLDRAEVAVAVSRRPDKKNSVLKGRTQINLFFEASTRTQASFEIAGKRLGVVFNIGARALTSQALNVHAGHDDVMSVADCNWGILFARNAQEAGDMCLISRRVAEASQVPFMNVQDGFLTTHEAWWVDLPPECGTPSRWDPMSSDCAVQLKRLLRWDPYSARP